MLRALSAGSEVGSCSWKLLGRRLSLWAALWREGIVLSQGFCRGLHFRQEGGFMNKSCCVLQCLLTRQGVRCLPQVPATGCEIQQG